LEGRAFFLFSGPKLCSRPGIRGRCRRRRSRFERVCGIWCGHRCCTLLLYPSPYRGSRFRIMSLNCGAMGLEPRPLACKQKATRPVASIAAGHRPGTCTRVRSDPGRLLYFPAVCATRRRNVERGERPFPLGRRSGLIEAGGSLIRGAPVRVGSSPDNAGTCWYCQTVRVRLARPGCVTRVNQWPKPRNKCRLKSGG